MADLSVQCIFGQDSNLPEDYVVNTWAFRTPGTDPTAPQLAALSSGLQGFYNSISPYLGPSFVGWMQLKAYRITDDKPRVPIADETFPSTLAPGSGDIPEEAAVCLSFRGELVSGLRPGRRRGRVYLGPLSSAAIDRDASNRTRVAPLFTEEISDAYTGLRNLLNTETIEHCVWSRADDALVPVTYAWVDNALDTQRRRGPAASARNEVWPTPFP